MRKVLTLLFSALLGLSVSLAQPPVSKVQISLVPDHSDGLYNIGETARFRVLVTDCGMPLNNATIRYEISKDLLQPHLIDSITLDGHEGIIKASSLSQPGFLRLKASISHQSHTYHSMSTVGYNPDRLRPMTVMPDDFMQFWENGKRVLRETALAPVMTLNRERSTDKVEIYDISYGNVGNSRIYGTLAVPRGKGPFPAILRLPGGGFFPRLSEPRQAARGVIVLDIGIHGIPVNMSSDFYKPLNNLHPDFMYYNMDNRMTFYYYRAFLGCLRGIDFLLSLPQCNGTIGTIGGSQGGALSIAVSALDPRVKATAVYHPGLCDLEGFIHGRAGGFPFFFRDEKNRTPEKLSTLRYYDVANFATMLKAPVHYTYGYNDQICTPTSTCSTYNIITAPKTLKIAQNIGHWLYPELSEDMWTWLIGQLKTNE